MKTGVAAAIALSMTCAVVPPAFAQSGGSVVSTSMRTGIFGGRRVAYRTAVEAFDTEDDAGKPAVRVVAISYVNTARAKADRPVLFVFNGGPIAPSAYLHMGAFGPRRVAIPDDIAAPVASFALADNPDCPLDVADIVFFDPAGTGFSRTAAGVDPASQFNVPADARQLTQLVLAWTRAHGRDAAPVYLVGESYGTLRAPEAAGQLAAAGRPPAGILLLGQAMNIIDTSQRRGNAISNAVSLPTMAAAAWYHRKAAREGRTFDRFMADARRFAMEDYLPLLASGEMDAARQRDVAARLQGFTGVSADTWLARRLRISKVDFARLLIPGSRLGTADARYVGPESGPDPFRPVTDSYLRLFKTYLSRELNVPDADAYRTESPVPPGLDGWRYATYTSPFGDWDYARPITELFDKTADFRLFVANGLYDTQTTIGSMDYLFAQNAWPAARIRRAYYEGGHMPYTIGATLKQLQRDVRAMVTKQW